MSDHASPALLGIFAKEPIPGRVKTRLAQETSPEFSAQIAEEFLRKTLRRMQAVSVERVVVYAPASASLFFQQLVAPFETDHQPQADGDLGERLRHFFASRQTRGSQRIVVIGSDSPNLPIAYIEQAFDELLSADVVLGPATDGGYYLVGLSRPMPEIFADITWSTATVLAETIARVTGRLALLPPWYDVDTLADLQMYRGHELALKKAAAT